MHGSPEPVSLTLSPVLLCLRAERSSGQEGCLWGQTRGQMQTCDWGPRPGRVEGLGCVCVCVGREVAGGDTYQLGTLTHSVLRRRGEGGAGRHAQKMSAPPRAGPAWPPFKDGKR